jgi:phosphoenolpyruvate carboxykinase (ATP)
MRYYNLNTDELYKHALKIYKINNTEALVVTSGKYTGRCPQDKRIVKTKLTENIWWGNINIPIEEELFYFYYLNGHNYINNCENIYIMDCYAGWDIKNQINIRVICTDPYHALFIKNMLIPANKIHQHIDLEILNCSSITLNYFDNKLNEIKLSKEDLNENLIGIDLIKGKIIIYGTKYAGEMKKAIFTYMMYKMPIINHLTLHSSACVNDKNMVMTFFGLSGTGKTTLSTSKDLTLIGDDEHIWTDDGIFNIEGGCYAKCLGLNPQNEYEIYNAIKKGAILENVVLNTDNSVNYDDSTITYNTRCSYPLNHLNNVLIPAFIKNHPKNIILLVCDAFGIMPLISKLTPKQAIFYFLLGYTCKMPGTEKGIDVPTKTFSTCFAEPFIIWKPEIYGNILMNKIITHNSNVWLLNTGWTVDGNRIPLKHSRKIVNLINNQKINDYDFIHFPHLNVNIPIIKEIPYQFLLPYHMWSTQQKYFDNLINTLNEFNDLFKQKFGNDLYNYLTQ